MSDNDSGEAIGALLMFMLAVMVVVTVVMLAVMAMMSVGTVFGAGTALRNYGLSFANNVRPQRVAS